MSATLNRPQPPAPGNCTCPHFGKPNVTVSSASSAVRVQRAGVAIQPRWAVYGEDRGPGQIGGRHTILFDEFIIEQACEVVLAKRVITDDRAEVRCEELIFRAGRRDYRSAVGCRRSSLR